jgi:methylmalonyl-CoA mutase N-terminal domain/subunit
MGQRKVVGLNDFTEGSDSVEIDTLSISPEIEEKQRARMARLRAERDESRVGSTLAALEAAAGTGANLADPILECARAYCTLYEIREAMEKVFGSYKEPVFF